MEETKQKNIELLKAKDQLHNRWSYITIIACMISIQTSQQLLSSKEINITSVISVLGVANLLLWWALNKYLRFSKDYAFLPATFVSSATELGNAFIGILPLIIGLSWLSSVMMFSSFRFMNLEQSLFTFFYLINGDTQFDSFTNAYQTNFIFSIFYVVIWINFGVFIIMQVALAMVEDGYLFQKNLTDFDFMIKKAEDPHAKDYELDQLASNSLTIPEAIKKINMLI